MPSSRLIIGLTGNIATGKSVVRQMLSNFGALGIDADVIAHRALYTQGSVYNDVVAAFGQAILQPDGQISRSYLAKVVFNNPEELRRLEQLVHPAVTREIQQRIEASLVDVIAIEAIKLLESPLVGLCDQIWVSHARPTVQLERLLHDRQQTPAEAQMRIDAQPPQGEKIAQADVVIDTEGSFEDSFQQVRKALNDTIQLREERHLQAPHLNSEWAWRYPGLLQNEELERFWSRITGEPLAALYKKLGTSTGIVVMQRQHNKGLLVRKDWNFTAVLKKVLPDDLGHKAGSTILAALIASAGDSQTELLIIPKVAFDDPVWQRSGFEPVTPSDLTYPAWQQAISSTVKDDWDKFVSKYLSNPLTIQPPVKSV